MAATTSRVEQAEDARQVGRGHRALEDGHRHDLDHHAGTRTPGRGGPWPSGATCDEPEQRIAEPGGGDRGQQRSERSGPGGHAPVDDDGAEGPDAGDRGEHAVAALAEVELLVGHQQQQHLRRAVDDVRGQDEQEHRKCRAGASEGPHAIGERGQDRRRGGFAVRRPAGVAGQPAQHDEAEGQDDGGRCRRRRRRGGGDQEATDGRSGDPSQRLGGGQQAVGRGQVRRRHRRRDEGVEGRVHRGGRGRGQEGDDGEEPGRCTDGDTGGDTDREEDAERSSRPRGCAGGPTDRPGLPPRGTAAGRAAAGCRPPPRPTAAIRSGRRARPPVPRPGALRHRGEGVGLEREPERPVAQRGAVGAGRTSHARHARRAGARATPRARAERPGSSARLHGTQATAPRPPDVGDLPCWHARGRCRAMTRIKTAALAGSDEALRLGHERAAASA